MKQFIKNKILSLSNRGVRDLQEFKSLILKFDEASPLQEVEICKRLINIGFKGISTYSTPLFKFRDYTNRTKQKLSESSFKAFISIECRDLSQTTKANYIRTLKEWAKTKGVEFNIKSKREHRSKFFSRIELDLILGEVEKLKQRDKTILKLIIFTGARISEVLGLKSSQIRMSGDRYHINFIGKGGVKRLAVCRVKDVGEIEIGHGFLFKNKNGGILSQVYIYRLFSEVLKTLGLGDGVRGVHTLRHSFASLVYRKTQDLILVSQALGHSNISTTKIYTHIDSSKIEKICDLF